MDERARKKRLPAQLLSFRKGAQLTAAVLHVRWVKNGTPSTHRIGLLRASAGQWRARNPSGGAALLFSSAVLVGAIDAQRARPRHGVLPGRVQQRPAAGRPLAL
jgi:hypothetical protein